MQNTQIDEYVLRTLMCDKLGIDLLKAEFEQCLRLLSIAEVLAHRVNHEGLPIDGALELSLKWQAEPGSFKDWVADHRCADSATLGNGWERTCSTKYPVETVRQWVGNNPRFRGNLTIQLDVLQELMPLPHHPDKVSRMMEWLRNARSIGLLTYAEESDIRYRLVQYFF